MSEDQKLLPPKRETTGMSILSNTLAIIGFIILAIIVIWGALHILNLSKSSLGSFFISPSKIEITTTPKTALSGQPITVSWSLSNETKPGSFAFLYQCTQSGSFGTQGVNDITNKIPCGASINVGSSTSATMVPMAVGTSTVSIPVSVVFTPKDGSAPVTGGATIAIAPATQTPPAQQAQAETPAPAQQQTPSQKPATAPAYHATGNYSPVPHAVSGPADLRVAIIANGYIDPSSGALLSNRAPNPGDIVGVEFDIANVGGSASGSYYFQAHLPTATGYTYTSAAQVSLAPGAHIVSTLRFTQLANGGGMFTAIADPAGSTADANRANNEAAVTIY